MDNMSELGIYSIEKVGNVATSVTESSNINQNHSHSNNNNYNHSSSNEVTVLHISNLSRNIKDSHLREIFSCYGEVKSVDLEIDRRVGLSLGYAYIKFSKSEEAEEAAAYMDGGQIDGMKVKVSFVLVPKKRRESPERHVKKEDTIGVKSSISDDHDRERERDNRDRRNDMISRRPDDSRGRDDRKFTNTNRGPPSHLPSPRGQLPPPSRGRSRSRSPPRRGPPVRDGRDRDRDSRRRPSPARREYGVPSNRRMVASNRAGRSRSPVKRDNYRDRRDSPVGRPRGRRSRSRSDSVSPSRDGKSVSRSRSRSRSRSNDRRRRYSRSSSRSSYSSRSSDTSSSKSYRSRSKSESSHSNRSVSRSRSPSVEDKK